MVDDEFSPLVPDDLRRADDWTHEDRPRVGLEGLPITSGEVVRFDEERLFVRNTPWRTSLVLWWCLGLTMVALGIWDGRLILVALGGVVVADRALLDDPERRDRPRSESNPGSLRP